MFETCDHAEVPVPEGLALNGERLWHYVQLHIHFPWLYVEYATDYEDCKLRSVLFLTTNAQLKALVDRSDIQITQVHVVTPGYVNKTDAWQMNQLKKVMTASIRKGRHSEPVTIYVLCNGKELIHSPNGVTDVKPRNLKTVFSAMPN